MRGAAAIVDLEKQLSRDESELEDNDQHALVPIYKAFMGPDRNRKPSPSGNGNQNVRQSPNPIGAHHHLQVFLCINGTMVVEFHSMASEILQFFTSK